MHELLLTRSPAAKRGECISSIRKVLLMMVVAMAGTNVLKFAVRASFEDTLNGMYVQWRV